MAKIRIYNDFKFTCDSNCCIKNVYIYYTGSAKELIISMCFREIIDKIYW